MPVSQRHTLEAIQRPFRMEGAETTLNEYTLLGCSVQSTLNHKSSINSYVMADTSMFYLSHVELHLFVW